MKKRFYSMLLACLMLLTLFPAAFAAGTANGKGTEENAVSHNADGEYASNEEDWEYIYDEEDAGADTVLRTDLLETVTDADSANEAIQQQLDSMTEEQKESTTGADLAALYAEATTAKAATSHVEGEEIIINRESVLALANIASSVNSVTVSSIVSSSGAFFSSSTSNGNVSATGKIIRRITVSSRQNAVDSSGDRIDGTETGNSGDITDSSSDTAPVNLSDTIDQKEKGKQDLVDPLIADAHSRDNAAVISMSIIATAKAQILRMATKTVTFRTEKTGIVIRIHPDILNISTINKIRVETPVYALTFKIQDLADDLKESDSAGLTILARVTGETEDGCAIVELEVPGGRLTNPVTISIAGMDGDTFYQTVASIQGTEDYCTAPQNGASMDYRLDSGVVRMTNSNYRAIPSKYNPVTTTMEGRVAESGKYTVANNQKDFSDIAEKSTEMQNAIRYLASKGIINGTTTTTFSPDNVITRAQIVALLMRGLGKVDNSLKANFTDVPANAWYYHEAASSQKHQIILGYEDGTFRGQRTINKAQITAVAGRILVSEMNYSIPDEEEQVPYLSKYSDQIAPWAQSMVALATRENLVVFRKDGTFSGGLDMTRGDAAILLYRLFKRIWY